MGFIYTLDPGPTDVSGRSVKCFSKCSEIPLHHIQWGCWLKIQISRPHLCDSLNQIFREWSLLLLLLLLSCFSHVRLCVTPDGSPPDSPVPGILQARTLEWVAISSSRNLYSNPSPGDFDLQQNYRKTCNEGEGSVERSRKHQAEEKEVPGQRKVSTMNSHLPASLLIFFTT